LPAPGGPLSASRAPGDPEGREAAQRLAWRALKWRGAAASDVFALLRCDELALDLARHPVHQADPASTPKALQRISDCLQEFVPASIGDWRRQ
jgi:hypothetical protein